MFYTFNKPDEQGPFLVNLDLVEMIEPFIVFKRLGCQLTFSSGMQVVVVDDYEAAAKTLGTRDSKET